MSGSGLKKKERTAGLLSRHVTGCTKCNFLGAHLALAVSHAKSWQCSTKSIHVQAHKCMSSVPTKSDLVVYPQKNATCAFS